MNWRHRIGIVAVFLSALIAGATWGTSVNHAVAPVPIAKLGLTPQNAEQMREFVSGLDPVAIVGADTDDDNRAKRVMLSGALKAANGGEWPWNGPQEIGDCASHGDGHAVEVDIAVQIQNGANLEFRPVKREWMYYGCRVRNGRVQLSGDGGIPGWGLEFGRDHGVLLHGHPGVKPYSGREAAEWGRRGPPKEFFELAAPYKIGMLAPVRSAQEGCNFLNAGYPIAFGSMRWGIGSLGQNIRMVEGRNVARDSADWPHAQCCVGYDGTTKVHGTKGLFRIDNSWGPEAHNPKSTFPDDMPGGYYATWDDFDSICQEQMAVAISGTQGFPKRDLNFDAFQAVWATAQPQGDVSMFAQIELDPTIFYGIAAVLLLVGIICLIWGNVSRWTGRAAAGLAMVLIAGVIQAQEISFQAFDVKSTVTGSKTSNEISFAAFSHVSAAADDNHCPITFGAFHCTCGPKCKCIDCTDCECSPASAVSVIETIRPEILSVYAPPWCMEPCRWLKQHLGEGDEKTKLEWNNREAWFKPKSYPVIVNRQTLKQWCQDPAAPDTRPRNMDELRAIFATKTKQQRVVKGVPQ